MKRFSKASVLLAMLVILSLALAGCTGGGGEQDPAAQQAQDAGTVVLGYVEWDSEIASTHVVKEVLESKMGYEVETVPVDAALMYTGLSRGDFDAIVSSWLPVTHGEYLDRVKDDVENLGANLDGAKIGLVVPAYVEIDSIEEMNEIADRFNGQIIGIEPGAGVMNATEAAIEEYGLDNFTLMDSSSAAMAASLQRAINDNQYIAVTGWTPHWKFAKFDLKYLDDPKGVYGGEEHIATLVTLDLKETKPEVYNFLNNFYWEPSDMEDVMVLIYEGMSPEEAAKQWVEENSDKVEAWLP
ncbi:glycine betaine ABC transporter substrate-binding protein [Desulfofalx alkaliphila]|uniref:glycine betaine ABC transporter substrate-binding protein n=1 Tax=Desulfofalx alkaliphila TaxID=105483 RepID=UPI000B183A2C|nr:glycine betaine ABC transporter substrate-binding protein [Desulfofalx alkaliphila]